MKPPPPKALSSAQRRYLLGALFFSGAATLALEIVGTRVISPYYGSSLYCWSALITVTLMSLAAGYNFGGRQADLNPNLTLFSRLISLAGAAVAFIPLLRGPVLESTGPLGIQVGALASSTILIAPSLILLSALGPLSVRLTTEDVATVGKSAGDVYALSTLGSVIGAVLSGFVLIPHFAISHILYGLSALLLLLGALGAWLSAARLPLKELAAAGLVGLWGFWPREAFSTNVLLNKESAYGQIKVIDFNGLRYLLVNGTTQSLARADTLATESQYARGMEWAALLRPGARRALVIGIGAGLLSGAIEKHYAIATDAVDIDPEIVAAARTYFGFSPRGVVSVEDGRTFLERAGPRYGLVFLDAFGTELPPYHLFTAEAFQRMKSRLKPGGVLAINIVSLINGPGGKAWRSAFKTLRGVFANVRAFQGSDASDDLGNVLLFCSDGPLDEALAAAPRPAIAPDLKNMLARELTPSEGSLSDAIAMTDDRAPMEFLLAETAERWRTQLQRKVSAILLY